MRRGLNDQAYTVVEVMIVLIVTGALIVSAMVFVSGQQRKNEFYQSIHDIEQQINEIINNVSTGYYAKSTNFTCIDNSGSLSVTSSGMDSQGSNVGCVFIGRAIQFGVSSSAGKDFIVYNLVGLQNKAPNKPATTIDDAKPIALAPASTGSYASTPDLSEKKTLKYGLNVVNMYYDDLPANNIGAAAFISSLGSYDTSNQSMVSGSQTASIYAVKGSERDKSSADTVDKINTPAYINTPAKSIIICFASGGSDQSGKITIGSENRQLSTKLEIFYSGDCT